MLSIGIYSECEETISLLKKSLQDFLISIKMMAKVSYLNDSETFITTPGSYDVYFMDLDTATIDVIDLGKKMKKIDRGSRFICISNDDSKARLVTKAHLDYFISKPVDIEELIEILMEIKKDVQFDNIVIKTSNGETRMRINNVNYINIVKRCLCYHLTDGTMFDGQSLRGSFQKMINPLQDHESFFFITPSILVNLGNIKAINKDHIVFDNDDILFFSMQQNDKVRNAWLSYMRLIEEVK